MRITSTMLTLIAAALSIAPASIIWAENSSGGSLMQKMQPASNTLGKQPMNAFDAEIATAPLPPGRNGFLECVIHNSGQNTEHVQFHTLDSTGAIIGNNGLDIPGGASGGIQIAQSAAPSAFSCVFIVSRQAVGDFQAAILSLDPSGLPISALPGFSPSPPGH